MKIVVITRPSEVDRTQEWCPICLERYSKCNHALEPMWHLVVNTRAGRQWNLVDPTLRGVIRLFRQARSAKCWDQPPIRPEDASR